MLALPLLLAACNNEISMDEYRNDGGAGLLTVNSLVTPDSVVQVMATHTYFFSDQHDERDYVRNLSIDVKRNSEPAVRMTYDATRHLYLSTLKVAPGDSIHLRTSYDDKEVTASDVVPRTVSIDTITVSREGPVSIYNDNDFVFTYHITFDDPACEDNYYFLQWDDVDHRTDVAMGERDFTHEFVFQQLANHVHSTLPGWEPYSPYGLPFSDKGIEGKTHTLVVREIVQMYDGAPDWHRSEMKRRFKLYTISKPYYDYLVSTLINQTDDKGLEGGLIDLGMAEPVKVYSNINGGVGILGCYTTSTAEIDVFKTVGPFPK